MGQRHYAETSLSKFFLDPFAGLRTRPDWPFSFYPVDIFLSLLCLSHNCYFFPCFSLAGAKCSLGFRRKRPECTRPFRRFRSTAASASALATASFRVLSTERISPATLAWFSRRIRSPASAGRRSSTSDSSTPSLNSAAPTVSIIITFIYLTPNCFSSLQSGSVSLQC